MILKVAFLVVFFAMMVAFGFYYRKSTRDVKGFVLGGRNVGAWLTAFAYGTSYFSAVIFVGYAGQFGWRFGVASTWIGIGNAVIGSLLAWEILGRRTRIMSQHLGSSTMPEFFGRRYDSKGLKVAASVITFLFMVPYTASLYNGLSRLFGMAFGIDYVWCVLAMAVLTGVYVIVGGYMATAMADFIQGIIMLGGIVATIAAVLNTHGGFAAAMTKLSQVPLDGSAMQGAYTSFTGPNLLELIGVVLLTSLGTWGLPQMVQKFYAIKNEGAIRKGTLISTLFALVVAGGCYFLGGFARLYEPEYNAAGKIVYDSIIPKMLEGLPDAIIGIVIVLVLAASMSTLSSLVLASSSTITLDFLQPISKKQWKEKSSVRTMRVFIVFFIAVSAVLAIVQANSPVTFIAQLMGISWGAMAGAFLAPFLYGLYFKKTTKAAVWTSFAVGVGVMVANMICTFAGVPFISAYFSSPINAGVLSMVLGLVMVPLVSLFTPKMKKTLVDEMYVCYNRKVNVTATDALEDEAQEVSSSVAP